VLLIEELMRRSSILIVLTGLIGLLILSACGQQDSPVKAVEAYLNARVASDAPRLIALSCKEWEGHARDEAASFQSMNAKLDSMSCSPKSDDGQSSVVACQGKIVTTYAGETRNWDLAARSFKLVKEDGQWKMCGYQ
jgi:hypothetical protein